MTKGETFIAVKFWEALDLIRTAIERDDKILTPDESATTIYALKKLQDNVLESLTKWERRSLSYI